MMKEMRHFTLKRGLLFTAIVLIAGLFFVSHYWQEIHYRKPIAAYYALASAMEKENKAELERLAPRGEAHKILQLAKPYGGIRRMGKLLRESPSVNPYVHVPFASIEVVAKIGNKDLVILFAKRPKQYVATTLFFAN
jgi:hypothetical protein